ncbi:PI-PLC X domain-containing protein 1 [Folsomia candida]|uniref:PI-PLC X domain-containing protein 1 n=1 Tax=Folsomia candida TaxID=158441 RepID=UPI000B904BB0|nr:PI-PLC X domain-containing protein 1 [Folsomia candida]
MHGRKTKMRFYTTNTSSILKCSNSFISALLCLQLLLVDFTQGSTLHIPIQLQKHLSCFDGLTVFLSVSAIAGSKNGVLQDRLIEINWNHADPEAQDWVGLFDHDPGQGISDPLEAVNVTLTRGYIKTDFRLDRPSLNTSSSICVGYWIAYIRKSQILQINCLSTYPKWMYEMRNTIGDTPLHSLMIPGTHNSGSWKEFEGETDVFQRYLVNQDESVYSQLVYGIRYLDIRVGYYPSYPEKLWVNHNFYRMRPLSEIVKDVARFVEETNEIVVMDFHRFPVGFTSQDRHAKLAEFLVSELGKHIAPRTLSPNATPNDLWSIGRTVIIAYSELKVVHSYNFLWPPLPQEWGDKRRLPDLKGFLSDALQRRSKRGQMWSAMAEFTPKTIDIVLRPTSGLRNLAQVVNIPMTYWFQEKDWYPKTSIVATDFFMGNNIIQTSIISNFKGNNCTT